jgi:hypothetical protein
MVPPKILFSIMKLSKRITNSQVSFLSNSIQVVSFERQFELPSNIPILAICLLIILPLILGISKDFLFKPKMSSMHRFNYLWNERFGFGCVYSCCSLE